MTGERLHMNADGRDERPFDDRQKKWPVDVDTDEPFAVDVLPRQKYRDSEGNWHEVIVMGAPLPEWPYAPGEGPLAPFEIGPSEPLHEERKTNQGEV